MNKKLCPKCKEVYLRRYKTNLGTKDKPKMYYHYIHKEHTACGFNLIDKSCLVEVKK